MNKKELQKVKFIKIFSESFNLGFSVALPIVGGIILGLTIDRKFNSCPKWTLIFLFAGIFMAAFAIFRIIKDTERK